MIHHPRPDEVTFARLWFLHDALQLSLDESVVLIGWEPAIVDRFRGKVEFQLIMVDDRPPSNLAPELVAVEFTRKSGEGM